MRSLRELIRAMWTIRRHARVAPGQGGDETETVSEAARIANEMLGPPGARRRPRIGTARNGAAPDMPIILCAFARRRRKELER